MLIRLSTDFVFLFLEVATINKSFFPMDCCLSLGCVNLSCAQIIIFTCIGVPCSAFLLLIVCVQLSKVQFGADYLYAGSYV